MQKIQLIKAALNDYPVIENMARFYVYDLSRSCGKKLEGFEIPENGLFECRDFKKYFQGESNHPFFIKVDNELAGFAFVGKLAIMPEVDWNMGEFFILAKFQGSGVGTSVAKQLLKQFPGEWSIGALPENIPALKFWRKVVNEYTQGNFVEIAKSSEALKTPECPSPYPMILLRFNSKV